MAAKPKPQALYAEGPHVTIRLTWSILLASCGLAIVQGMSERAANHSWTLPAALTGYVLAWLVVYRTCFVTRRIYATPVGVQILKAKSRAQVIPWSKVESPEYASWSYNPLFPRVAAFAVKGEARRIYFYASPLVLARFRAIRTACADVASS
jgi:hypothetical protein